jgi:hypothetical protein
VVQSPGAISSDYFVALDTSEALGKRIYAGLENPGFDRVTTRASS